jgi:hypothetical protein
MYISRVLFAYSGYRVRLKMRQEEQQRRAKERRKALRRRNKRPVSKKIEDPYLTWMSWTRKTESKKTTADNNASK